MKRITLLLLTTCLTTALAAPLLSQQSGGGVPPQPSTAPDKEATGLPPEPAGKHKANSKLYSGRKTRANLIERAKEGKSIDMLVELPMPTLSKIPPRRPTVGEFVQQQVCSSDAVVVGRVAEKESYLTENKDWVFTDYELAVDEVFKSTQQELDPGSQVTVTRTGGEVLIYGRSVRAAERLNLGFHVGRTYVLFLKFLPASESYKAVGPAGAYEIASGKIRKMTDEQLIPELDQPFEWENFKTEIMVAAANTCDLPKGGSR